MGSEARRSFIELEHRGLSMAARVIMPSPEPLFGRGQMKQELKLIWHHTPALGHQESGVLQQEQARMAHPKLSPNISGSIWAIRYLRTFTIRVRLTPLRR